jgi:hypothetical protein
MVPVDLGKVLGVSQMQSLLLYPPLLVLPFSVAELEMDDGLSDVNNVIYKIKLD